MQKSRFSRCQDVRELERIENSEPVSKVFVGLRVGEEDLSFVSLPPRLLPLRKEMKLNWISNNKPIKGRKAFVKISSINLVERSLFKILINYQRGADFICCVGQSLRIY